MKALRIVLAVSLLLTIATACQQSSGTVVAQVDGTRITSKDLLEEMRMERGIYDPALVSSSQGFEEFRRRTLDRLVQEAILLSAAKHAGITVNDEEIAQSPEAATQTNLESSLATQGISPQYWKESQRKRLMIRKLIEQQVVDSIPVTDAAIEAYYKSHAAEFRDNTQYHARQILVDSRETADKIHAKILKGEDFGELAKQYSASPDGKRGGDLGYFDAQSYPEVFSEICGRLSIGQVSEVKATPYGFQIFQLLDKRPARQRPLAEVKPQIRRTLQEEHVESVYEPWFTGLTQQAQVKINEQVLKEVKLEG